MMPTVLRLLAHKWCSTTALSVLTLSFTFFSTKTRGTCFSRQKPFNSHSLWERPVWSVLGWPVKQVVRLCDRTCPNLLHGGYCGMATDTHMQTYTCNYSAVWVQVLSTSVVRFQSVHAIFPSAHALHLYPCAHTRFTMSSTSVTI